MAQSEKGDMLQHLPLLNPYDVQLFYRTRDIMRAGRAAMLRNLVGTERGGDWDLEPRPVATHPAYQAIFEHYLDGVSWSQTRFYRECWTAMTAGQPQYKLRRPEDFGRVFANIERLHDSIKTEGYRSQHELGSRRPWDEVVVAINRHGEVCLVDGIHRLALAHLLQVSLVPVVVAIRHSAWVRVAKDLREYKRSFRMSHS
jgi:hypothetical protein